jgi:glutamate/tyrosine decarboxylase-like PLP-dependent enzyme
VIALAVARQKKLGNESRKHGSSHSAPLTAYAVAGVHNAIVKAMELLGLGSEALRRIPVNATTGGMDVPALIDSIAKDRANGKQPFCVIGTAGSVDCGAFDDLPALADVCARENLWFHVDGAFGAWTKIAAEPWNGLSRGIERADSLATDFHKWMYVQYDCGMVLIRDEKDHRATFAARPAYLAAQTTGVGEGDPWFCDYGTDLSRGFRALKVWTALRCYGRRALGRAITRNCELATLMGDIVQKADDLRLMAPVRANLCCFSVVDAGDAGVLNETIVQDLQMRGEAVFSTTKINGMAVIRAAITNHRTREDDVHVAVQAIRAARHRLDMSRVHDSEV